jgi:hypothetical protein
VGNPLTDAVLILPAVQAARAAVAVGQTTLREVAGMVSALRARLNGRRATGESNARIRRAAKDTGRERVHCPQALWTAV